MNLYSKSFNLSCNSNMFNSSNPSPSSIHGCFPPSSDIFLGQEKDGVFFNNHKPFVTTGEYCSSFDPTPPPVVKELGLQNCNNNNLNLLDSVISPSRKRVALASKKDRHSKIFTAQGPRDRRVRLSIDISKKFFGLQDLLGYDKASKTLDWLFTKSKTAIKDLVQEMKHTSSSNLSDQCEEVFMEKLGDHGHLDKKGKKKAVVVKKNIIINGGKKKNKKQVTQKHKSGFHVAARSQLRAEARSRARERTIEKLRIKNHHVLGDQHNYLQSSCGNQIQSPSSHDHEVKIGESLTEQKLPKPYSLIYNSQSNLYVDSRDSRSQFKNH